MNQENITNLLGSRNTSITICIEKGNPPLLPVRAATLACRTGTTWTGAHAHGGTDISARRLVPRPQHARVEVVGNPRHALAHQEVTNGWRRQACQDRGDANGHHQLHQREAF